MVGALSRDHPSGSVFHLCDGPARRLRDLGEAIRLAQGTPAITLRISRDTMRWVQRVGRIALRWTPELPLWFHPDSLELVLAAGWTCADTLIRRTLGWEPTVTLLEGLAETVDWYREAGWLLRPWGGPLNRRELRPSKVPPGSKGS
jgi:nucleoside-diphosphate-sugar epimerase